MCARQDLSARMPYVSGSQSKEQGQPSTGLPEGREEARGRPFAGRLGPVRSTKQTPEKGRQPRAYGNRLPGVGVRHRETVVVTKILGDRPGFAA